jgi:hypothetical protein
MRRVVLAGLAVVALTVLAGVGYLAWQVRSLDTPEFQAALVARLKRSTGADVRLTRLRVSLLSGVRVDGLAIANPAPFPGDLLTAKAFVLRYRLWPLLAGRLEIGEATLEQPAVAIALDARGVFNYERFGAREARGVGSGAAGTLAAASIPLRIVLSRLTLEDATLAMKDHTGTRLVSLEGARLESAFELGNGVATGTGTAAVRTLTLGQALFVRDLRSPLQLTPDTLSLSPLRGGLGGGSVSGDVTVRFKRGLRYTARLEVARARVKTLLAEAGARATLDGTLRATARLEGSGGLATVSGRGEGSIADCRLNGSRALALVAGALGLPELAAPDLDECRAEFTQQGYRVTTPVLLLKGPQLQLSGHGTLRLDTSALDYDLTLALPPRVFARVTREEMREAFRSRADGWATIDFRLTGTTLEPKTDLLARLGRGAVAGAIKKGLGRLFGRKDPP